MKRPFFSIPIATYNRVGDVVFAIQRILSQSFTDFEIIICDDNSTDDTEKQIKKIKDKRIRYFKNKKNLGAVKNIGKVLEYVRGQYVFMHGDDDYLLYDTVLEKIYRQIQKHHYGLLRLNYVYQTFDKRNVFDYLRNKFLDKNLSMQPHKNPVEVVKYIEMIDLYFITGIVFKNIYPQKITILDSELIPWFYVCYENILKSGAVFLHNHEIVASWSHQDKHPGYFVKKGKLSWEGLYDAIRSVAGDYYYRKTLLRQLTINVHLLPIIKYNSNNQNLLHYAKRIRELHPAYKKSLLYWTMIVVSLVIPHDMLKTVREIYIQTVRKKSEIKEYNTLKTQVHRVRGFS